LIIPRERQRPYFVGRRQAIEELERALTPFDGSIPPHAIFVTGLPGIGRRSLVRQTVPAILNFRKQVEIRVGEEDSIHDICINVADRVEPYSTKEGLERIVMDIRGLPEHDALQRTLRNLRDLALAGELPVFVDEGGLLDFDGSIRDPIRAISQRLEPNDDAYVFLISRQRPHFTSSIFVPVIHLRPLTEDETKRLVSLLANRIGLQMLSGEISELSEYVAGYPPAAYYAVRLASDYGLDLVLRDKRRLIQFRLSVFLRHLSESRLSDTEQNVLRLLATYSPLPFQVMVEVLHSKVRDLSDILVRLIDLALVITTEEGHYRIADPVADAVVNTFGFPPDAQTEALTRALSRYLGQKQIETPQLELTRVLFQAARLAGDEAAAAEVIHFASDLIKLTETLYHARRYGDAVRAGHAALEERPKSVKARSFLIRALIQEEKHEEAEEEIERLRRYTHLRDICYLRGFLRRKQHRNQEAIRIYKESEKLGRRGSAISRELAHLYLVTGNLEEAARYVTQALEKHGDDSFLVDLWAKIAIRRRDEATARTALQRLELLDELHYYHRLSRLEYALGRWSEARDAAKKAVECSSHPPFEILAQLVYCDTELGHLDEASEILGTLDQRFGHIHRDIRLALRCRLEIQRGRYSEALRLCDQISSKTTSYYKRIRHDALAGETRVSALSDEVRSDFEDELARLEEELQDVATESLLLSEYAEE